VERNLSLLAAISDGVDLNRSPRLYPSEADREAATAVAKIHGDAPCVCIAPGSVWATKRWTAAGFAELAADLGRDYLVVLIGGFADRVLCEEVRIRSGVSSCVNSAGRLSLTASAALIGMSALLVSNDSAPVHMASAMGTPVVAIFGATTPELGFAPFGVPGGIVQLEGLDCRPCGAHGGRHCPIGTFECMRELASSSVISAARKELSDRKPPLIADATR
jgi:heptosyltransferase-2